jgi:hypothetical protein
MSEEFEKTLTQRCRDAAMFRYGETRRAAIQTTFTGGPAMFRYGETRRAAIQTTFTGGPWDRYRDAIRSVL